MNKIASAVVTSGGLCPGMNTVLYELSRRTKRLAGFRHGYKGVYDKVFTHLDTFDNCLYRSAPGCILGTSRVHFDKFALADSLHEIGVKKLYVIGGEGTLSGAHKLAQILPGTQVIGIPKTIDNDICGIDYTFGFHTAIDISISAIVSAHTEARDFGGIAVVKLMGRNSGFLCNRAAIASGVCDVCITPEEPISFDDILCNARRVYQDQGYCTIAVTDGMNIAIELCNRLRDEFSCPIKYIDPGYMVRATPPNGFDLYYCTTLAMEAHAAMSRGEHDVCVGMMGGKIGTVPLREIADQQKIM